MYRVLRILNRFNLGGPTYNASYLTRYLNSEFQTRLLGGRHQENETDSLHIPYELGLRPIIIPTLRRSINPYYDILALAEIRKHIKSFQPTIVHTHAAKAGVLGRLAAFQMSVPIIVHTFHGHVFDAYFSKPTSRFFIQIERQMARLSDAIVVLCPEQYHDIVNVYRIAPAHKVHIIPLGLDLRKFVEDTERKRQEFRAKYKLKDDIVAIAIVGRLAPVKNHAMFLEAVLNVIKQTQRKIRVFIVGDGKLRNELEKQLTRYGLSFGTGRSDNEIVTFTSWVKDVDVVYAGVDIVALTSKNEGTPVSIIEAIAARKAVVTTLAGGLKNIVEHNVNALTSDVDDVDTFTRNLLFLVENEDIRIKLAANGQKSIFERFHFQRLVKDMENLYYSLIEQKLKKA